MKKVVKVSIGNLAFTVEEDGFLLVKGYLDEIQDHYESNENGREILEGIEERMAELFLEKSGSGSVVTSAVIKEVISILGRPEAIDEEQGDIRMGSSTSNNIRIPKKLYRNGENKVLGGVCSGLAAFSSLDVSLVRIIFVVLLIGFSFFGLFHIGGGSFMVIGYIIMWLVIPEARTVEQKCAMFGEPMDLSYLHQKMERNFKRAGQEIKRAANDNSGLVSRFGRLLSIIVSILLIIIASSALASISFMLLGLEIFKGVIPIDLMDYVYLGVQNPIYFKIAILAFMMLPFLGMLYGGIQLLFGFKTSRIRPGLIILLLWIVSLLAMIFFSVKSTRPYWNQAKQSGEIALNQEIDTLYVRFAAHNPMPKDRVVLNAGYSDFFICWMDNKSELVIFPDLRIVRQSAKDERTLTYKTYAHAYNYSDALIRAEREVPEIKIEDSIITISPKYYSKSEKWSGSFQSISLNVPENVVVIVKEPIEHNFDKITTKDWMFGRNNRKYYNRRYNGWERRLERKFDKFEEQMERFGDRFEDDNDYD